MSRWRPGPGWSEGVAGLDWAPSGSRDALRLRAWVNRLVREFFFARDVLEVETPMMSRAGNTDPNIASFALEFSGRTDGASRTRWLRTSPEFPLKRLLAAGVGDCFELGRVFRDGEAGGRHNPEFTMLEWYRAGRDYEVIMADCVAVIREAASATGADAFAFRGRTVDPFAEPERLTVADAFARLAGIDLPATISERGEPRRDALANAAAARVRVAGDDTWSDIFSKVLVEYIEPHLGQERLTILCEYPAPEAALARAKPSDPRIAERFEVYACGVELANGFGELVDAREQRRRFIAAMDEKERRYGERYPLDEDFLAALESMPEASGVALGFDRLVMLASGATRIDQVVWTPPEDEA